MTSGPLRRRLCSKSPPMPQRSCGARSDGHGASSASTKACTSRASEARPPGSAGPGPIRFIVDGPVDPVGLTPAAGPSMPRLAAGHRPARIAVPETLPTRELESRLPDLTAQKTGFFLPPPVGGPAWAARPEPASSKRPLIRD